MKRQPRTVRCIYWSNADKEQLTVIKKNLDTRLFACTPRSGAGGEPPLLLCSCSFYSPAHLQSPLNSARPTESTDWIIGSSIDRFLHFFPPTSTKPFQYPLKIHHVGSQFFACAEFKQEPSLEQVNQQTVVPLSQAAAKTKAGEPTRAGLLKRG